MQPKKKSIYLTVKDNGFGMSHEHLERIFTIFQRLHIHDEYEVTGIGLEIAQKLFINKRANFKHSISLYLYK